MIHPIHPSGTSGQHRPPLPAVQAVVADGHRPFQPLALTGHDQALESTRLAVDAVTADPYSTSQIRSGPGVYSVIIYYGEDQNAVTAFAEHFGGTTTVIPVESTGGESDVAVTASVGGIPVTAWTRVSTSALTVEVDR
ncbi:hypothetical protein ACIBJC_15095 [Streptomyces sp. NPDC050509]|uniref:hypothetical protein n=1 Tax=Streptomyces sp. NPDC050509 TaxID=3365620 RepID=UPI00378CB0CA